jgi:colanic acid biosynthesis glycosyl transferase WcaI
MGSRDRGPAKPRLLVFNQYYAPGVEATAHLLTELCEDLAHDHDVTVVTGRLRDHEAEPDYEFRNGVQVIRVHSTAFDRAPLHRRAANYFTYLARALRRGVTTTPPDIVLAMTDPPMVGDVAWVAARRFRAPLVVISQDVFPEIAVELNRLTNPLLIRLLDVMTRFYLRRADRVVAIGGTMQLRLEGKGVARERLRLIPNWADPEAITPQQRDNAWAREHDLTGRFVVMHSGNIGHAQDLETLIGASLLLEDVANLSVVLVGFGARHAYLQALTQRLGAGAVRFLPYQARQMLSQSLSSADIHFVGLGRGLSGYVVPSRVYGIMAAGRPILVAADDESETARLVREVGCGLVVEPGDPAQVAQALSDVAAGKHDLAGMGRLARQYVETEANRSTAMRRYRDLLGELLV